MASVRLRSVIVGGVLASAAWIVGPLPVEAQAPSTATTTSPAPAPADGVPWGAVTEEREPVITRPEPSAPARTKRKDAEPAPAAKRRATPAPAPAAKKRAQDDKDKAAEECAADPARPDGRGIELLSPEPQPGESRAERKRRLELARLQLQRDECAAEEAAGQDKAKRARPKPSPTENPDSSPTPSAPGFMATLPGPSTATGVPNFVINKFRVPPFLLSIYQAAGIQYGVRWEILAAINEIETDYGRNLNVSSAGAAGWMQFMPATWEQYGTDANDDGAKDPYNPVDAIFAAARYLKAAGFAEDQRRAVFAYNHADWYVDSVMLRAKLIAGVPADLIGSLTGLTEGRFPVAARARYAEQKDRRKPKARIFTREGAPVVASQDGRVVSLGRSRSLGRYIVLADAYGNHYTYAHLGSIARRYPVPKRDALGDPRSWAKALSANAERRRDADPAPKRAASAGRQPVARKAAKRRIPAAEPREESTATKRRLFAHPYLPTARANGGEEQMLATQAKGHDDLAGYFARPFGLDGRNVRLTRLRKGSQVIGGTVLGRVGRPTAGKGAHLEFSIRPAGKGAPVIDPKPILDGWKLLEATAVYRASGRNALYGDDGDPGGLSIGQILLLPKPQLEKRVLADPRVEIYAGGREDIQSGQIDRRVLATLEYLAESGLHPTVTSLKGNHGLLTASGNVSEHSSGNAVDIGAINGVPITGHQERGDVTEQAVRRLMLLQGTVRPHQIISLLDLGANTLAMGDHDDHIHVGFHPRFGDNERAGREAMAVLAPGQWSDLIERLRSIDQPTVPTARSKAALPVRKRPR